MSSRQHLSRLTKEYLTCSVWLWKHVWLGGKKSSIWEGDLSNDLTHWQWKKQRYCSRSAYTRIDEHTQLIISMHWSTVSPLELIWLRSGSSNRCTFFRLQRDFMAGWGNHCCSVAFKSTCGAAESTLARQKIVTDGSFSHDVDPNVYKNHLAVVLSHLQSTPSCWLLFVFFFC